MQEPVVVLGQTVLEIRHECEVVRVSPEGPVPIVRCLYGHLRTARGVHGIGRLALEHIGRQVRSRSRSLSAESLVYLVDGRAVAHVVEEQYAGDSDFTMPPDVEHACSDLVVFHMHGARSIDDLKHVACRQIIVYSECPELLRIPDTTTAMVIVSRSRCGMMYEFGPVNQARLLLNPLNVSIMGPDKRRSSVDVSPEIGSLTYWHEVFAAMLVDGYVFHNSIEVVERALNRVAAVYQRVNVA